MAVWPLEIGVHDPLKRPRIIFPVELPFEIKTRFWNNSRVRLPMRRYRLAARSWFSVDTLKLCWIGCGQTNNSRRYFQLRRHERVVGRAIATLFARTTSKEKLSTIKFLSCSDNVSQDVPRLTIFSANPISSLTQALRSSSVCTTQSHTNQIGCTGRIF
jgi:hypothetical protein